MRREGRIPHRRLCVGVAAMREGVSGEISDCSYVTYDRLEPEDARTNSSKIRGPARIVAHGKAFSPKEKCLGKVKGQRKKRDRIMESLNTDVALVDPELPSSWKARQIALHLADSEDLSYAAVVRGSNKSQDAQTGSTSDIMRRHSTQTSIPLDYMEGLPTDGCHWGSKLCTHTGPSPAQCSASIAILRPGLLRKGSEEWAMHSIASPSDQSSLCSMAAGVLTLSASEDLGIKSRSEEPIAMANEADNQASEIEGDWDVLSQFASDWDIVSEIDSDASCFDQDCS